MENIAHRDFSSITPQGIFPVCIAAERSVLGDVLIDESVLDELIDAGLRPEHFGLEQHRQVFRLVLTMQASKAPIDSIAVAEKLGGRQEDYVLVGSVIDGTVVQTGHTLHHARIIRDKFYLRELAKIGTWLEEYAYVPSARPESIVAELKEKLGELGGRQ